MSPRLRTKDFHLPERVYQRRGRLYYAPPGTTKWIPLDGAVGIAEAQVAALKLVRDTPDGKGFKDLRNCFERTRKNARHREIQFALTWEAVIALWQRSKGRCEISGIAFSFAREVGFKNRPFAPSIDRIKNDGIYSVENCRLVCVVVNLAMNEWGLETLLKVSRAVHMRRKVLDTNQ